MPKMKTRKAVGKRFKVTKSGKLKYKKAKLRHILTKKSADSKRKFRKGGYIDHVNTERMKRAMVYV